MNLFTYIYKDSNILFRIIFAAALDRFLLFRYSVFYRCFGCSDISDGDSHDGSCVAEIDKNEL